jgi:ABC-type tungstate transport system substrate-binding protein
LSASRRVEALQEQAQNGQDPTTVSVAIGDVMGWTLAGILIAFLGHILMAVSVGISRYRARWFFWAIVISAPLLIPSFPLGTFVLVYALVMRKEFFKPAPTSV